ncbi:stemmadenine O-acetyltransferase-like isoform X2 [Rhodamnia argentea]|uniref:Stemmadenine O-acetyltransferase-like isoform X2 n=1 Tax=Rhodamnia argentea TaxID=178133 RepID=A0ABM3H3T5_9MYRT|nr:stemmadenine O-acetyltransferase-like isoform X2 [Rhodamnia argentea]
MEVEVVSKEFIKPSSPTPNHLKSHKLSLLDQFMPPTYCPMLLYYTIEGADRATRKTTPIQLLKQSLSKTLALFYPFAGKMKDDLSIDCNDEGALFIEARAEFPLSLLLERPDMETIGKIQPRAAAWGEGGPGDPVAMVQATTFACGGVAVCLLLSHTIADGVSFMSFFKCWAATARNSGGTLRPNFDAPSFFIPGKTDTKEETYSSLCAPFANASRCGTRRFVFDASATARLKAKASNSQVRNPTRAEVVTALMLKSITAAWNKASNLDKPGALLQPHNLRPKAISSFPDDAIGNYVWPMPMLCEPEAKDNDLPGLVSRLREMKAKVDGPFVRSFVGDGGSAALRQGIREISESLARAQGLVSITSWCNFGHYEIDFGWGRPAWVSAVGTTEETQNLKVDIVILLDTKSREGVEAWVFTGEDQLDVLEQNEELLEFASVDPSAFDRTRVKKKKSVSQLCRTHMLVIQW